MKTKEFFPKGFLWGTATAAHQVEGNNKFSDWWHWEKSKKGIEDSDIACDHYRMYKEDFHLAKNLLNNNSHRISIEWARIEPKEGRYNQKEILHYKKVLQELRKQKLASIVTLNHFTNPLWFAKKGGWTNSNNIKYFENFVNLCIKNFGQQVDYWVVINEPNVYTFMSYLQGFWPPQKHSLILAYKTYKNLAKAHNIGYQKIHDKIPNAKVSSAINMVYFKHQNAVGALLSKIISFLCNYSFLSLTKGHHDYIGLNYYMMHLASIRDLFIKQPSLKKLEKLIGERKNDLGWPIYPEGIYEVTQSVFKRYKLPILITENGLADGNDSKRGGFLKDHLSWLRQSIKDGAQIIGYTHWTLMDNFEWRFGRRAKFGLFETDYKTLKRIPRPSAFLYSKIAKENAI